MEAISVGLNPTHIFMVTISGVAGVVWAVVKWAAFSFEKRVMDIAAEAANIDARLSLIERDFVTRSQMEGLEKRMDDRFARVESRLDQIFIILSQQLHDSRG